MSPVRTIDRLRQICAQNLLSKTGMVRTLSVRYDKYLQEENRCRLAVLRSQA